MASSGGDHAVREQSRSPVPRCRARAATVSPRPTSPPWYIALLALHHRSNWMAPTWSRHLPRGLRSYKQGRPLLHHMPVRALRPAPAAPHLCPPFGSVGSINGCCWRWTDTWSWLDTSALWRPRDGSTQLPRRPEAKCCQNLHERLLTLQHHHHRHNK